VDRYYKTEKTGQGRLLYGLLLFLVAYVALLLASGESLAGRAVLLRFWSLLAVGVFAVATPHVLLPDPHLARLQLANRRPRALLVHQLRRWLGVPVLFAVPALLLAFFDPGAQGDELFAKGCRLLECWLVMLGTGLYSCAHYATIGTVSQAWQEGTRGQAFRAMMQHTTAGGPLVPYGLVPALFATQRVFLVGMAATVAAAYLERVGCIAAWGPGLLLVAWAAGRMWRHLPAYDRHFYATNAFYSEVFRRAGGVRRSSQEPVPYRGVYWVPRRWKPHVWAGLRQLDRRLPLGRFMGLGHALLWVLVFQGAPPEALAACLVLLITAKNAAVYLLATDVLAPAPFQVTLQAPAGWMLTRFFVNVRWTLPLLLSLLLAAWAHGGFGVSAALGWTAVDLGVALASAALVTYGKETRYRKRYA
jgi:hypothetical protein